METCLHGPHWPMPEVGPTNGENAVGDNLPTGPTPRGIGFSVLRVTR